MMPSTASRYREMARQERRESKMAAREQRRLAKRAAPAQASSAAGPPTEALEGLTVTRRDLTAKAREVPA